MRPDNITVPRGRPVEVDTSNLSEAYELPDGVCEIEVVDGPTTSPYGTLVVSMKNTPTDQDTLTRLRIGWAHSGEFKVIWPGTTVTLVRYWR